MGFEAAGAQPWTVARWLAESGSGHAPYHAVAEIFVGEPKGGNGPQTAGSVSGAPKLSAHTSMEHLNK